MAVGHAQPELGRMDTVPGFEVWSYDKNIMHLLQARWIEVPTFKPKQRGHEKTS